MVCDSNAKDSVQMTLLTYNRDHASKISQEERDVAAAKLDVYRNWFSKHVMRSGESMTIVLIPIEEISPRYRDEAPK